MNDKIKQVFGFIAGGLAVYTSITFLGLGTTGGLFVVGFLVYRGLKHQQEAKQWTI